MSALSPVEKESVGLRGTRMGTKENKIAKAGKTVFMGVLRKNGNILLFRNIFFLGILINVKAGRVN
jgi:hypothetical protein